MFVIAFIIPMYYFLTEKKPGKFLKIYYEIVIAVGAIGLIIILLLMLPILQEKLSSNSLSVFGKNCSIGERLTFYFVYFYEISSNVKCEFMINGENTSISPMILIGSFLVIQIGFYVCHFISRMQPQHFVPLLFLVPILLFSQLGMILRYCNTCALKVMKRIIAWWIVILIGLNVRDHIVF